MKLWMKILIALVLGTVVGAIVGPSIAVVKPVGTIFLKLINMIIVLLVFASMTLGITSIHDPKKLGRIGLKTLGLYTTTTVISILLGLAFASYFEPGKGIELTLNHPITIQESPSILESLVSLVPTNPMASLVSGNVLQIIVFSLFLGISINAAGERGKPLLHFFEALADVMYKLTGIVMEFAPYGVFAIMAWIAGSFGLEVLLPLGKLILVYYLACFLFVGVVFCGILYFIAGLHPLPFFKGMRDAIMVAFSTGSSSATLPVTMHCTQENLGVSKKISCFVLPIGCTINMNGTAIFQAMGALFVAQAYDLNLNLMSMVTIVVTATVSSIGTAGIPSSGFIMLSAVLTSVGLPLEGLAILAGIDRLRDMIGTVLNIVGDAVVAVVVAKQEGELDEAKYCSTEELQLEGSEV